MNIRTWLVALALAALSSPASAADESSPLSVCKELSIIAKDIMTARQENKPMSEALSMAIALVKDWGDKNDLGLDMEVAEEAAAPLVMGAYEEMIKSSDTYRRLAITEFENEIFQECYEEMISEE